MDRADMRYCLLILALSLALCNLAFGQADSKIKKQWESWKISKGKADKKLEQAFDRKAGEIRKNQDLPAETRNTHVKNLMKEKAAFVKSAKLPESDDMLPSIIEYLDSVQGASAPLQAAFERALEQAIGKDDEFDEIQSLKKQWQSGLPGRDELAANTEFHGTRVFNNGVTVDFHFHVDRFEDNSFAGRIWQDVFNVGGKAGWEYEAILQGNQFKITTLKMLHGTPRKLVFRGYIIERRVIMTLTHRDDEPLTGDFVSLKKK
jgi:hypothetical protein